MWSSLAPRLAAQGSPHRPLTHVVEEVPNTQDELAEDRQLGAGEQAWGWAQGSGRAPHHNPGRAQGEGTLLRCVPSPAGPNLPMSLLMPQRQ